MNRVIYGILLAISAILMLTGGCFLDFYYNQDYYYEDHKLNTKYEWCSWTGAITFCIGLVILIFCLQSGQ